MIDLETGGFERKKHAVLEIAIVLLDWKDNQIIPGATHQWNIEPEANLVVEAASLEVRLFAKKGIILWANQLKEPVKLSVF